MRKAKEVTVFENDVPQGERENPKPKRVKKKTLGQHADELIKKNNKRCTPLKHCALLSAVLAVSKEDEKRPGIEEGLSFSMKGQYQGVEIVYFARRAEYAVMSYCPFCGGKIGKKK